MDTNINHNPKISVLLPVYNGQKYLRESIESILNQTFTDFELILINDGSIDASDTIITSYNDPHIRYEKNDTNRGLIYTLNKGLKLARGKYIARMDADDISLRGRLETQYDFMEKHLDIGISGSWAKTIEQNKSFILKKSLTHEDIKADMLWQSAFIHPTVIMRKKVILDNNLFYDANFPHSEDRELWFRAIEHTRIANIKKCLLLYRIHEESITRTQMSTQTTSGNSTIIQIFKKIGLNLTQEETNFHRSVEKEKNMTEKEYLKSYEIWLKKIYSQNKKFSYFNNASLQKTLCERWFRVCRHNAEYGISIFVLFLRSPYGRKTLVRHPWKTFNFFRVCLL